MRAEEKITRAAYEEIYRKAEPYWATRKNDLHVPCSYDYARRLLTHYHDADEDVVLPAVLLHDVGWKMVPEDKQRGAFGPEVKDREMQRFHETEGVRIAREILHSLDYDKEKTAEILAIIDGHDSREKPLSLNDKLVKDADKLWRFTPYCVKIAHRHFGFELEAYILWLGQKIDGWFFTDEAKDMARKELNRAGKELLTPPSEREV
jgi:HD superfamily phosphodiesterase